MGTNKREEFKKVGWEAWGGMLTDSIYLYEDIIYNVLLKLSRKTMLLIGYEKNITVSNDAIFQFR